MRVVPRSRPPLYAMLTFLQAPPFRAPGCRRNDMVTNALLRNEVLNSTQLSCAERRRMVGASYGCRNLVRLCSAWRASPVSRDGHPASGRGPARGRCVSSVRSMSRHRRQATDHAPGRFTRLESRKSCAQRCGSAHPGAYLSW